jgi:hypothetical protein
MISASTFYSSSGSYQVSTLTIFSLSNILTKYFPFLLFQSNDASELNLSTDVRGLFGANNK